MPPTIPASLLKAVQCRHHCPPPFVLGSNRRSLTRTLSGSHPFINSLSPTPRSFPNCRSRAKGGSFVARISPLAATAGRQWVRSMGGERIQKEAMGLAGVNGACKEQDGKEKSSPSPSPSPSPSSKLLTLPTLLTLGRVASVPLLVSTFYMDGWWATTATTSIFIAAAVTDWLDGYLARKLRLGTAFGAFLDPVADKLMVAATLVLLCTRPLDIATFEGVPWLLTVPSIAIIGREITMSAVREWAASQNSRVLEAVAVNSLGKWKTATQMTALTILLATRDPSLSGQDFIVAFGVTLLYISAGLALWSLAVYMRKIWRVLLK